MLSTTTSGTWASGEPFAFRSNDDGVAGEMLR
jgi:hypothetical protein